MFAKITSCGNLGINGYPVYVECDVGNGLPIFEIVGLGDSAVKEARERVRSAIKNSGFEFPVKRITINLAPANMKKEGSLYDLGIALGILAATSQVKATDLEGLMILGELSLDGLIRHVKGVLPMACCAKNEGLRGIILPEHDAGEAALVDGIEIIPASSLKELAEKIKQPRQKSILSHDLNGLFAAPPRCEVDFSDIKGHAYGKRALEIAASGGHNLLLTGSPGTGKTMLARSLAGILPDMEPGEALEVTRIHSVAGILPQGTPLVVHRPFRNPHFNISASSLVGGGPQPKPGEISLSHNGVLFLDEIAEFSSYALNALRQPLEERVVNISRVSGNVTFPANAAIIAATNPCRCGNCLDASKKCTCTLPQIQQYRSKLSGPLLDRLDMLIEIPLISYKEISSPARAENSTAVKRRVAATRALQTERYRRLGFNTNAQLSHDLIEKYCVLADAARSILEKAYDMLSLSMRSYTKILKVSRTIADIEKSDVIKSDHISEAIQYRCFEKKWGLSV